MDRATLTQQGYVIDSTCYPWCAYKGYRFRPDEHRPCLTDLEAQLAETLRLVLGHPAFDGLGARDDERLAQAHQLLDAVEERYTPPGTGWDR